MTMLPFLSRRMLFTHSFLHRTATMLWMPLDLIIAVKTWQSIIGSHKLQHWTINRYSHTSNVAIIIPSSSALPPPSIVKFIFTHIFPYFHTRNTQWNMYVHSIWKRIAKQWKIILINALYSVRYCVLIAAADIKINVQLYWRSWIEMAKNENFTQFQRESVKCKRF